MTDDASAIDNKTLESFAVEDVSLNQSEIKQHTLSEPSRRPIPVMVPVVFEKNESTVTASDKKKGRLDEFNICY